MPTCKSCGKFFFSKAKLDNNGRCQSCAKKAIDREEKARIFLERKRNEFQSFMDKAEKVDIVLSSDYFPKGRFRDMPEVKFSTITKRNVKESFNRFVCIDVETTGLFAGRDKIIELSAVYFEDFSPCRYVSTFVNPNKDIPKEAIDIHGITNDMVSESPKIEEILPFVKDFIGALPLVGHNLSFDMKFLYKEGLNLFVPKHKLYDTLQLSKKVYKDEYGYSLKDMMNLLSVYPPKSHRSLYDSF